MREIEFRAKTLSEITNGNLKKDGTWVYGYYRDRIGCPTISEFSFADADYIDYEVDVKTLGQYTGLKDKNGTKIFEGDIVNMLNITDYPMQIKWNKKWARFIFYNLVDKTEMNLFTEQCEVIGNIYDNPELIKEWLWKKKRLILIMKNKY